MPSIPVPTLLLRPCQVHLHYQTYQVFLEQNDPQNFFFFQNQKRIFFYPTTPIVHLITFMVLALYATMTLCCTQL